MWFVFLGLFLFASATDEFSYEGFQVLRIPVTPENIKEVVDLSEAVLADVWHVNRAEGWIDVMVSPQQLPFFSHLAGTVKIQNVQETINESRVGDEQRDFNSSLKSGAFPFDFFPTSAQIRQWTASQASLHRGVLELFTLGRTYLGQEIQGLSIGDKSKPMFYMHCTIHAREWIATTTCLWIIDQLLNEPENRALRNEFHWVIIPVHNVDGYDYTRTDRLWRKNRQPNPGSTCVGTDINRNYAYEWGGPGASPSPCSETYRGAHAWSCPEGKVEDEWLKPHLARRNVKAYVDIHSYGGYILSAWGYTTKLVPKDFPEMDRNMRSMAVAIRAINGNSYTFGQGSTTLYESSGSTKDELYGAGHVVNSYTVECSGTSFTPPTSSIPIVGREVWAGIKALAHAVA